MTNTTKSTTSVIRNSATMANLMLANWECPSFFLWHLSSGRFCSTKSCCHFYSSTFWDLTCTKFCYILKTMMKLISDWFISDVQNKGNTCVFMHFCLFLSKFNEFIFYLVRDMFNIQTFRFFYSNMFRLWRHHQGVFSIKAETCWNKKTEMFEY